MSGIRINSNNFNGESVEITFNPFSGGSIDLGTQTIPYDYLSSNYEGNYSIYIPTANKTCPLQVGTPPSPSPSPTSSVTPSVTPSITPSVTVTPTPSVTITPTPSASVPSGDADANAYIAAIQASGGTTDTTIENAIQTLFTSLKSNGLYSKIDAMYPYVGGTAASHAIEAKLNKSFDITWYGGMTHDVSGSTGNGSNGYGDTGFNPYVEIGSTGGIPAHSSVYVGTKTQGNYGEFGARDGGNDWLMAVAFGNTYTYYGWQYHTAQLTYTNTDVVGNHIQSRTSSTNFITYKNGVLKDTVTSTENRPAPDNNLRVFSDTSLYSNRRLQFTTIGEGLSASEIVTLDGIINTFQTSLGRNTYISVSDPDAQSYIDDVVASGGTIDQTIADATNTLFTDLKSAGLYSKMLAMYPYVGSTAASHSINALLNKTYDITWYGGMTHGISGSTGNGSTGYGDTHFSNGLFTQNSLSAGYYQINNTTETLSDVSVMGVYDNNKKPVIQISSDQNNANYRLAFGDINSRTSTSNNGNRDGNYIATRTTGNTSSAFLYRNNNLEITTTSDTYTSSGSLTSPVFVFNFNLNSGSPYGISYSNATLGFTFMGEGLSASEVSTLDGIINTFQTSLGRNTYT